MTNLSNCSLVVTDCGLDYRADEDDLGKFPSFKARSLAFNYHNWLLVFIDFVYHPLNSLCPL